MKYSRESNTVVISSGTRSNKKFCSWLVWAASASRFWFTYAETSTAVVISSSGTPKSAGMSKSSVLTPGGFQQLAHLQETRPGDGRVVKLGRDTGRLGRRHGGPVGLNVVRVPVIAVLVVGDDHLRAGNAASIQPAGRLTCASGTLQNTPGSLLADHPSMPESR